MEFDNFKKTKSASCFDVEEVLAKNNNKKSTQTNFADQCLSATSQKYFFVLVSAQRSNKSNMVVVY